MKEAMATALKSLVDRLGAMSLAEGIETEEELNLAAGSRRRGRSGLPVRPSGVGGRVALAGSYMRSTPAWFRLHRRTRRPSGGKGRG